MHAVMTVEALYTLVWQTRPLLQQINAAVESALAGTGLTLRMRAVLELLLSEGAMTVPALARRLEIQRQYVQVMVNETCAARLTELQPNPAHRRSSLVLLTAQGHRVIARVRDAESKVLTRIARKLPDAKVRAALEIQNELLAAFRRINSGANP
jgi:DNA-binding MarR family transcriptional regulator